MGIKQRRGRSSVTFQSVSTTQSSSGEYAKTWSTYATRRCTLDLQPGSESSTIGTNQAATSATISVRYVNGLDATMRAVVGGRTFEIESVTPVDNLKREQLVELRELV
jgi:SPP1 family predicted phage head-tail adaptor